MSQFALSINPQKQNLYNKNSTFSNECMSCSNASFQILIFIKAQYNSSLTTFSTFSFIVLSNPPTIDSGYLNVCFQTSHSFCIIIVNHGLERYKEPTMNYLQGTSVTLKYT